MVEVLLSFSPSHPQQQLSKHLSRARVFISAAAQINIAVFVTPPALPAKVASSKG